MTILKSQSIILQPQIYINIKLFQQVNKNMKPYEPIGYAKQDKEPAELDSHIQYQQNNIFCYTEGNPMTLVMLHPLKKMQSLFIQDIMPTQFVYIYDEKDCFLEQRIQQIFRQTKVRIKLFKIQKEFYGFLKQNKTKRVIVIHSDSKKINEKEIYGSPLVCKVISYSPKDNFQQLKNIIKSENGFRSAQRKNKNFLFIQRQQLDLSFRLFKTIHSMLNQPIDQNTRNQIISQLEKLYKRLHSFTQFSVDYNNDQTQVRRFFHELREGMTPQSAIRWYTNSHILNYKILNNLLRSSNHPAEIFYIQPYLINLFKGIQSIYKNRKQSFVCYRGGWFTKEEIEKFQLNKGKQIISLSFLSTSLSKTEAQQFGSTILEIHVDQAVSQKLKNRCCFGYASISSYSFHSNEKQILFNPLNPFYIKNIYKRQGKIIICLQYGYLERVTQIKLDKLGFDKEILRLIKSEYENSYLTRHQGQTLITDREILYDGQLFLNKYQEVLVQSDFHMSSSVVTFHKLKSILFFFNKKNTQLFIFHSNKYKLLSLLYYGKKSQQYFHSLILLYHGYTDIKNYDEAKRILSQMQNSQTCHQLYKMFQIQLLHNTGQYSKALKKIKLYQQNNQQHKPMIEWVSMYYQNLNYMISGNDKIIPEQIFENTLQMNKVVDLISPQRQEAKRDFQILCKILNDEAKKINACECSKRNYQLMKNAIEKEQEKQQRKKNHPDL